MGLFRLATSLTRLVSVKNGQTQEEKGTPLGVRKGRICNTALRIHVIVPRNCDK